MMVMPENKFGYLSLFDAQNEKGVLIKANKITAITHSLEDMDGEIVAVVYTDDDELFYVKETMDQILEQLENIHPSML